MKKILGIFLILATSLHVQAQIFEVKKNELVFKYDRGTGKYSVSQNNNLIIKDAVSYAVLSDGTRVSSENLNGVSKISEQVVADALGKGKQYTVSSKTKAGIEMKQHFFLYDQKPIILVQLEINGKNIASNDMSPLYMQANISGLGKALYQVAVPFDNDTFISYENESLSKTNKVSAEVGVVYDKNSNHGLVIGSLDQSVWKSGISIGGNQNNYDFLAIKTGFTDVNITRDSMGHGFIKGNRIISPKYLISYVKDWRVGMEDYAKIHRQLQTPYVQQWTAATPVGWNSWGVIQEKINFQNATATAQYFEKDIPHFRNADGDAFIDLDSFWDNMTPGGMSGDYSQLEKFVHYCDSLGLKPGVYWAPFTDWGHGSGLNRTAEGSSYKFGDMWTKTKSGYHNLDGGRALDPTHPGTLARMDVILGKLVACGFKMIKIDFLSHAAIESTGFYDKNTSTGMQAYAVGMKHLVDVLKGKMLIYAAISPSLATNQFAHMRRIACDAWKTLDQTEYTLNSVSYGWWQTYLYDFIDADHLVFHDEPENVNKARLLSGIVAGTIILGDDLSKKENWQKNMNVYLQDSEILKVIADGKSFRPAGFVEGKSANQCYFKKSGKYLYVAIFNFSNEKQHVAVDFTPLGLNPAQQYVAEELFTKTKQNIKSDLPIAFNEGGGKLFRITL